MSQHCVNYPPSGDPLLDSADKKQTLRLGDFPIAELYVQKHGFRFTSEEFGAHTMSVRGLEAISCLELAKPDLPF